MFKNPKKPKKKLPPGTFIPFSARISSIIHLCIVFTVIGYILGTPFLEDLFKLKEQEALYQNITANSFYEQLPIMEKQELSTSYNQVIAMANRSVGKKLLQGFQYIFIYIPAFKLAWILLSVILPVLLLKKVEGAKLAIWILPLLALCYSFDQLMLYPDPLPKKDHQLFPSESQLISKYLPDGLPPLISKQQSELKKAWHLYLVEHWGNQIKTIQVKESSDQLLVANLAFSIARFKAKLYDLKNTPLYEQRQSPLWLFMIVCWNLFFCSITTYSLKTVKANKNLI